MSKGIDEQASEILIALIQARGQTLAGVSNKTHAIETHLSAEVIAEDYKNIYRALKEAYNG